MFVVLLLIMAGSGLWVERLVLLCFVFSDCVFLKRRVLFVFIWWQLNNPAVREFERVFIDIIFFFGRCYWLVEVCETKWGVHGLRKTGLFQKSLYQDC